MRFATHHHYDDPKSIGFHRKEKNPRYFKQRLQQGHCQVQQASIRPRDFSHKSELDTHEYHHIGNVQCCHHPQTEPVLPYQLALANSTSHELYGISRQAVLNQCSTIWWLICEQAIRHSIIEFIEFISKWDASCKRIWKIMPRWHRSKSVYKQN